jgi:Zn-dependent protease with chaperone function
MKQLSVFLDFKEWLTFRTKRIASIVLVILGILSAGLFFLPLTLRIAYLVAFTALAMVPVLSTVDMVTGSIITQVKVALYDRKHKPRVEIWPQVKKMTKRMGIKHSGKVFITSNPAIHNAFVNLYTKKITVSESWLRQFHKTETLASIGHELGHIKGRKRFMAEMLAVMIAPLGFAFCFSFVAICLRLPVIPIFLQITTFTIMFLLLSFVLWRNEYRADLEGAYATSPEALIAVFEGLQGNQRKANKKDSGSETHPPLHSRIQRLKRLLESE